MNTEQARQLIATIDKESPPDTSLPRLYLVAAVSPAGKVERWEMHRPHPLAPEDMIVLRMYQRTNGIKVYSVSVDGKAGVLTFLPMDKVIMTSATMDVQVLLDQLDACEVGDDEDEGDVDGEPESDEGVEEEPQTPDAPASNGQTVS